MADKVFRFKLKDAKSGEGSRVSVAAASEDEAVNVIEGQEADKTAFVLPPEEAAAFEKQLKEGTLSGRNKALLFTHRQLRPYKIVKGG